MELLTNPVRAYAWGSRTVIAELLGRPVPSPHPEAELWLGAHPGDPSHLATGKSLVEAISADPDGQLGADRAHRWDATLPFLLKVLAADEPLSLQAHPSLDAGAGRVRRRGVGGSAARRARPQLPRRQPQARADLRAHPVRRARRFPGARRHASSCCARSPSRPSPRTSSCWPRNPMRPGLRALFTTWITLPQGALDELVPAVVDGAVAARGRGRALAERGPTVLELAERYPGDAGVLAALLLNRVTLAPGEAIYLPAGNLHAYLSGSGVELMANSDNVLRGGLTPKHVDVPELLRVLDFDHAGPPPVLTGSLDAADGAWVRYDTPAEEFLLRRCDGRIRRGRGARGRAADPAVHGGRGRPARRTAPSSRWSKGAAAWLAASDIGATVEPQVRRHPAVPRGRRAGLTAARIVGSLGRVPACRRAGERARSSRRWRPTRASRSRSSSAS